MSKLHQLNIIKKIKKDYQKKLAKDIKTFLWKTKNRSLLCMEKIYRMRENALL